MIRTLIRRSIALTCAAYLVDDWRARRRLAHGRLTTRSGTRHADLDVAASLTYIERVYGDYLAYADRTRFTGAVAEIGPGDNFGVATMLLAGGATTVHAIDRYRPARDSARQRPIYVALAQRMGRPDLFDGPPDETTIRNLHYHDGIPAEAFFLRPPEPFAAILSRAVLEHLYDPLAALDHMAKALQPGGTLVHRIDMRDHGMFAGRHPLTFLTVTDRLYTAMTRGAGRPNRVLWPAWRQWLEHSGLHGSLRITRLAGVPDELPPARWGDIDADKRALALAAVRTIRPRLAASLRPLRDEDLAVSGCVLVATKPNS